MFVLSIVLAVLSGLAFVTGAVWAVCRFGQKVVRSGPEVWKEMQPKGDIQLGYGTGVAVESSASMRLCDMKTAWKNGLRREVMPFFIGMAGMLGLFLFIGLAMVLARTTEVRIFGWIVLAGFAYAVWFTVSGLNEDPGIPAEPGQAAEAARSAAGEKTSASSEPDKGAGTT